MNNDVSSSQNSTAPIEVPDSEPLVLDDDVQIINNKDNCVNLDEDSDVIVEENNPVIVDLDSDDLEIIESNNAPIVIDDEDRNCVINPLNIIRKKQDQLFDTICQENILLAEVIEEAINLDPTGSMKRIIQRTLIPIYQSCSTSYKESEMCKNSLKRTKILLETAPHLKYSHIKSLCETLKYTKIKLKLRKQTRSQTSESSPTKRMYKYKKRRHKKRRKNATDLSINRTKPKKMRYTTEIINQSSNDTMIEIEIPPNTSSISPTSNKENIVNENILTANDRIRYNCNELASIDTTLNNVNDIASTDTSNKIYNTEIESNNLLRPYFVVNTQMPPEIAGHTVESLEKQIAHLKMELEEIEEQEVTADNMDSPYLRAEAVKLKIVNLYKQLCKIMGAEPTKRHEVKLQVVNGHPPGPARCLEEYINDNIDEFGNPPFPDIFEVVRCVERAVEEDGLKWNRKQIVAEAQVLLKHYGHAIQKRRKKREWRDMIGRCKQELVDPADLDPALEAKLLENSRIAKRNEDDILDRYARLEKENMSNPEFRMSLETGASDSESDSDGDIHGPSHTNTSAENHIRLAPRMAMADSTTNPENVQGSPNIINSTNTQRNLSIINSTTNILQPNIQVTTNAINSRNVLEINPQGSSIISTINVVNKNSNIVQPMAPNASNFVNSTGLNTNLPNCPIIVVNSSNNFPNLHGSICYINSTPVFATRIQGSPSIINPANNLVSNLQNTPNNFACNLQNGPNFINSNNLASSLQSCPGIIDTSNNIQGNLIIYNNARNLQNGPNFMNSNNLMGNLQSGHNFMNSNNLAGNLQSCLSIINTSNTEGLRIEPNNIENDLQCEPNVESNLHSEQNIENNLHSEQNIENNLQSRRSIINTLNNIEDNLKTEPNIEGNLNSESNTESNLQSRRSITNTLNNLEDNLKTEPNTEENLHSESNTESNLQSRRSIINSLNNIENSLKTEPNTEGNLHSESNTESNLQSRRSIIDTLNNLEDNIKTEPNTEGNLHGEPNTESNLQSSPSIINTLNNIEGNLHSKPNNTERNLHREPNTESNLPDCPINSTTGPETHSTITNIGNIEYNRTISMDSDETNTDSEIKEHTDIVAYTNTVIERDKNDIDEVEYKIKVKQEEDDVIQLLSELGSDCVGTVFDIEDPFLVIEISDSSDEDE